MSYKSVVVTKRGGPEVLKITENELKEPSNHQVRIRIMAVSVGRTDVNYRYGYSPLSPKVPFVPGYSFIGIVDKIGNKVSSFSKGDRVAALTGVGGYSEIITLDEEHLVKVPESLDYAEASTLILNYVTAYQMLHRIAKVKSGDKVLLIGASGGVGSALMQLGKLAKLNMYGLASPSKFAVLETCGVIPIDYHNKDFVEMIQTYEPLGFGFVFDGLGGKAADLSIKVLHKGGKRVSYAAPSGLGTFIGSMLKILWTNLQIGGKKAEFYGISVLYQKDKELFKEDLRILFKLLEEGEISPLISEEYSLLEAAKANERLETGSVVGNIVLLAPEVIH